ncbi:hypothetical protein O3P69_013024 [Scylla paramamosain]|uniref:Uncharacterized protein n=1 Tax=Scylla paramamosain TaxID=85552 RepID=A0AAW0TUC0_SCYPA
MTAETKARANANLSDIIAGAGESVPPPPATPQPSQTLCTNQVLVHSDASSPDSIFSPNTPTSADQPCKFKQRSGNIPADRSREPSLLKPTRERTGAPPSPPPPGSSLSRLCLGLAPSDTCGKAEDKVTKPLVVKPQIYEYLMAAVNKAQDKASRGRLPRAAGMSRELLMKIQQKYEEGRVLNLNTWFCCSKKERQKETRSPTVVGCQSSGSIKIVRSTKRNDATRQPSDVLKTPSCQDYLAITSRSSPSSCDKTTGVTGKMNCPGTTIISPQGLLQRHEDLQRDAEGCWHPQDRQQEPLVSSQRQERMEWVFDGSDSQPPGSQRTPSPVCLLSVSQCPKSVVINPMRYLEYFAGPPQDTDRGSYSKDTHLRATHPRDTHLRATHPRDMHLRATHPRDTHLRATHPRDTHLRATQPRDTHLRATHPSDTHPRATHSSDTYPRATHPRDTYSSATHPRDTHMWATHPRDTDPMATQDQSSHTSQAQAATATHRATYVHEGVNLDSLGTASTSRETEMYSMRDKRHLAPYPGQEYRHTWQGSEAGRGQQIYDTGWQYHQQHINQSFPSDDPNPNPWHQDPVSHHSRPLLDLTDSIFPRYLQQPPPPPPPPPPPVNIFQSASWETLQGSVPRCNTSWSAPLPEGHLYHGPGCERTRDQFGVGVCAGGGGGGGGGYVGMMYSQPNK